MRITDLSTTSDAFTDEYILPEDMLKFFNQGIAYLNSRLKTKFPFAKSAQEDYTALKETWLRQIVGNYMSYGIKMQDGSLNEAREYKEMFTLATITLEEMMYGDNEDGSGGEVDAEYLDPNEVKKLHSRMDTHGTAPSWFTNDWR